MRSCFAIALASLALTARPLPCVENVELGDHPDYRFRAPLINGLGVEQLSDLRGWPVLVQFWDHNLWGAVQDMMKLILVLQVQFQGDLQVVLVEERLGRDDLERLLLQKGWLHTEAMWTSERPFIHGSFQEPCCVLLSAEGEVIFKSPPLGKKVDSTELVYSNQLMDEIEAAIAAEVERRRKGPSGATAALRSAYEDFSQLRIGRAFAALVELGDGEAAARARADLERRVARRLSQAEWLVAHGAIGAAEERLNPLQDQLSAVPELDARLRALRERLASDQLSEERKADKALASLEKVIFTKGATARSPGSLKSVAGRYAGTLRGTEAARLAKLLAE